VIRLRSKAFSISAAVLIVLAGVTPAAAAAPDSNVRPVRDCADLVKDFNLPGARTHVTSAKVVPAGAEPEHCDVGGFVEPAVKFQLKLPTTTYTGRYLQYGCGGLCGFILPTAFPDCGPGAGDAAVGATDDGHSVPDFVVDGRWAANNQAARDDYFFRAPHVVSKAAKRIIAEFYGAPPKQSYFSGCSNGGREALLLAQRYPHDFDGIIAAAPANYYGPLLAYQAWLSRSNTGADGAPILTPEKIQVLHSAVMAACDRLDGLVDGQLEDPRACHFDPASLRCHGGPAPCLTAAQLTAVRKLYAGPSDEGRRLYPGGQPFGSELAWVGWITPTPEFGDALAAQLADQGLKYLLYPIGTPHSSLADFRFTARELDRLAPETVKANAMSLDLREFRRSGGKLILWHGWADQGIPPVGVLDYYQRLTERSGGPAQTREWARLFMVPGIYHCAGGTGLTDFDPLRELVGWVERGTAPNKVIARGLDEDGNVVRTRPVFPYPLRARYDGSGSIDDASNFVPARPSGPARDVIRWVGEDLYAKPGPVAP
jgi:feruloyl esterase